MQLFALNQSGELVAAAHASAREDHLCLECRGKVRLRAGLHRQRHFYHLQLTPGCRLSKKSMEHLQTQVYLQKLIGEATCQLEVPFPDIGRIADVVWTAQRLVFEVQCSPIRAEEVAARNSDYARIGWQVVWLLHTKTFGRERLMSAELLLRNSPCYFTDLNADGEGQIVDCFDMLKSRLRTHVLENLIVDMRSPKRHQNNITLPLARVRQRLERNSLYFSGDLVDLTLSQPDDDYIIRARRLEAQRGHPTPAQWWQHFLWRPYRIVFQHVLETLSR